MSLYCVYQQALNSLTCPYFESYKLNVVQKSVGQKYSVSLQCYVGETVWNYI